MTRTQKELNSVIKQRAYERSGGDFATSKSWESCLVWQSRAIIVGSAKRMILSYSQ